MTEAPQDPPRPLIITSSTYSKWTWRDYVVPNTFPILKYRADFDPSLRRLEKGFYSTKGGKFIFVSAIFDAISAQALTGYVSTSKWSYGPARAHELLTRMASSPTLPDKLHPTLSSWFKNMNKLDGLINRLHDLASSAPTEQQSQLLKKVRMLSATLKKQQERFTGFLQLSEEYANKYLLDITTEIRQQSTVLDNLEERLEAANKLHGEAVDLQMYYESRTVANMNDLRATGKAYPVVCISENTETFSSNSAATSTGRCPVLQGGARAG